MGEAARADDCSVCASRLAVLRLTLHEWRSFSGLELEIDSRPVVLAGANGAGKTNILEAISLLGPGRGLRGAELAELGRRPAAADESTADWAVSALLEGAEGPLRVGVGIERDTGPPRRIARLDGRMAGPAELARHLRIVWTHPGMDRLFSGAAGERRKFFDRLAMGFYPEHGQIASAYERAMRERQKVLEDQGDPLWLDALERRMAETGASLAAARVDTQRRLMQALDRRESSVFPQADLDLIGEMEVGFLAGEPAGAIETRFMATLRAARGRDRAAGRALSGPHRADWPARHRAAGRPAAECSTGEQKALQLSILLAYARALADEWGSPPLLLIDEAGAHLDSRRRDALWGEILDLDVQAWLTGTDIELFSGFGPNAQIFSAGNGRLKAVPLHSGGRGAFHAQASGPSDS